ncbi:nucleolar pre-ribosomal-associated protein 1 [Spea bombifrons]|uniref:nucleolar pre-ribosomal-associated protein 1 n=1 Tax=Spea bombifrons TaxID=233779 RepID=UPI0023491A0C|nr:nucleolar pre-ribosomal-associated protein 1 [Spea bombifrons]
MGNKRRSSAPMEPAEQEAKKPKPLEVEFTGTHFKSMLKDPQTALKGLGQFLNLSRKLPSTDLYDVVEGYIKISVECIEILKLLDGERRPENENMIIFQVLEAILLRTASDLSHLNVAGVNIVKTMLNSHMKIIYASVYSVTHRMSRICLNLLSAMVTQGPECARDVFSHFDFNNKFLPGLLKKRDKQGRPDVRMAYIQFALSFLISGDNTTIVQVLELKDFIGEIFSTGVKEDRISIVNLLLSLLGTKVVHNKVITKTQKVRFFTSVMLNHIASLYRWNGIVDVSTEDVKNVKDTKEAGKVMVRELVHGFLMDLCCSLKHGINFYDPSLGTAGRAGNLVLLRFLVSLKSATEDDLVAELAVNILKVCPDLLGRYFKETQYSFAPRLKSAWLDNIKLLKKIYEALPPVSAAFRTTEFVPFPRLISMVMVTTVAPVCNKAFFTQGLNLPNKIVKHTILSLVSAILKRAEQNIHHCLREDVWQKSEIYTLAAMAEFSQKYKEALSKLLPDMNTVVAVWQSLLKTEGAEADGKKGAEETPDAETNPTTSFQEIPEVTEEEHGSDDFQSVLLKASLLQVLCLYQRVVPHLVAQCNFDFSKLLKGIVSESGIREEVPPMLQQQILQVALELPASKFSWFKFQFQDVPDVCGEKSVFYLLLKMFVSCNKPQLKNSTRLLIIKVLRDSGVFEYTWKELDLWLRHLDKVKADSSETVIRFLERVLIKVVSNPYPYSDKAADYVQEASVLQTSSTKQDSDTVSIPISHIDDVLDMVDVIVEGSEGLDEEIGFTLGEDLIVQTFPFSAVVPVALEARNKLLALEENGNDCVLQYLVSVLTDVLHTQRDPLALCLMIQSYDKELNALDANSSKYALLGRFYKYYSLWVPTSNKETLFSGLDDSETGLADESSYSSLLKKTFMKSGPSDSHEEETLKDVISQVALEELPVAVRHTVLYLKTTADNFSKVKKASGANLVRLFLDLLQGLLRRYEVAKASHQQAVEETKTESELFVDSDSISVLESQENTILEDILGVIFRHPTLENWFLALERQSVPPHSLSPVSVKLLSSSLNQGVIQLLTYSARLLQESNHLQLASKYFDSISESVLKELESFKKKSNKISHPFEALQNLHPYMDTAQLNPITLAVLRLPKEFLLVDKELSAHGRILVQLLTEGCQRKQQLADLTSSVEHVRGVGSLLSTSSAGEIETVLYEALRNEPALAHVCDVDVLTHCLNEMTETCLSVAALLIQNSRTHLLRFELWCLSPGIEKRLKKHMDVYLPLISKYLECRENFTFSRPSEVSSAVLHVLKDAFWSKLVKVALTPETPEPSLDQAAVLSRLIRISASNELENVLDQLPDILAQSWSREKWLLAESVSQAAACAGPRICSWKRTLLAACMKCLTAAYNANKEQEEGAAPEAEAAMASRLKDLMPFVKEDVPDEWNKLVKTGLKYRYKDCTFLDVLNAGVVQWYDSDGPCTAALVELPVVHMMITQHSLFLPTLLRSREEEDAHSDTRELLVDLLRTIVKKCPSVCDGNHFAVLLGAYGATMSRTDQKILLLLQSYERNNLSLTEFRLLLWGPAAVEHHKTRKSLGKSLWQQPSMEEILCLLDRDKMMKTILNFPLHRKLTTEEGKEAIFEDREIKDLDHLYDPCFLLPLFSELIRPELVVDCAKFVDVNALGLTVVALSSYDYNMRAAANYILGSFVSQMEGARFRDKKQLQYLMDIVKNGVRQENLRLTFLLALYVAKAAQQVLKPEDHMYIKISKFILSHQYLDMKKVPDFYKLFYSFDLEHKAEREWILGLLCDGLRDRHCYELCDYQRIFHVVLAFYNSPLCDETFQNQIIEILLKASRVTKAAYQLIRDHSLLTFILNILEKRYLENKTLSNVVALIANLWLTNLGNKGSPPSGEEQKQKFLPLHLVNEFLGVSMALLKHIRPNLDPLHLNQFFSTVSSVLRYRSVVLGAFKEMGRFAVNERMLSSKDILLLLHKWSTVEKDLVLQERLASLAQEHKVKELLSTIKEKYKPQGNQQHKKKKDTRDEAIVEEQLQPPSLDISRDHMKAILIQWEPVFSNPPISVTPDKSESMTDSCHSTKDGEAGDRSGDADILVGATACLVAEWILNAESEHTPDVQDIYKSLSWFQRSILPHSAVVQKLLKNNTLKSIIFKLYNKVCGRVTLEPSSLELLHAFNMVMVRLIESLDLGKTSCHGAVKELCLVPDNIVDDGKRAAGNFLVSLYVGDVWLVEKSTNMFRTHVEAVCSANDVKIPVSKEKTPARKKRKAAQEAIVSICKELLPTTMASPR